MLIYLKLSATICAQQSYPTSLMMLLLSSCSKTNIVFLPGVQVLFGCQQTDGWQISHSLGNRLVEEHISRGVCKFGKLCLLAGFIVLVN